MTRSDTQDTVLSIVHSIPTGRVTTYGTIADQIEGTSARSVGRTLKAHGHEAPWWRVVNAAGRPAPGMERVAQAHFAEEHTPLTVQDDDSYSVDLTQALWQDTVALR